MKTGLEKQANIFAAYSAGAAITFGIAMWGFWWEAFMYLFLAALGTAFSLTRRS